MCLGEAINDVNVVPFYQSKFSYPLLKGTNKIRDDGALTTREISN